MQKINSVARAREPEETIVRLSWILIRQRKVLFVRSPEGEVFFDPGGRKVEGTNNLQVLAAKIHHDLGLELDTDSAIETSFTFAAPAYGKDDEVMVEMHCYMTDYAGELNPVPAFIAEMGWFTSNDMRKTSPAGRAILQYLEKEGLID